MAVELASNSQDALSKSDRYRQLATQFLLEQSNKADSDGVESRPIFDMQRDRYLILTQGWRSQERVYWVAIHLDLQDGKVWIQRNQTEVDIESELIALGIPGEDIIRGTIPVEYRVLAGLPEG